MSFPIGDGRPFWVKGRAGDQHVHPAPADERDISHRTEEDGICWCQPSVHYEDPVTGSRLILHKDADC